MDWLGSGLSVKRGIVEQNVDEVKTESSAKTFVLAGELLARLKAWKQLTRFSGPEDWIFASPVKIGRQPYFLHRGVAGLATRCQRFRNRRSGHARFQAHVPQLARCSRDNDCSSTKDDETHGHSHHDEHLWGRGNG